MTAALSPFVARRAGAEPPLALIERAWSRAGLDVPAAERRASARLVPRLRVSIAALRVDEPGRAGWVVEAWAQLAWPFDAAARELQRGVTPASVRRRQAREELALRVADAWRVVEERTRELARAPSVQAQLALDEARAELDAIAGGAR